MKLLCAWCSQEEIPKENQSHGICDDHANQLKDQSDARHFKDVPSYIGEREQFDRYTQEKKARVR